MQEHRRSVTYFLTMKFNSNFYHHVEFFLTVKTQFRQQKAVFLCKQVWRKNNANVIFVLNSGCPARQHFVSETRPHEMRELEL